MTYPTICDKWASDPIFKKFLRSDPQYMGTGHLGEVSAGAILKKKRSELGETKYNSIY